MKELTKLWKRQEFHHIYEFLKLKNYNYTIDNFTKDFAYVNSQNKFCYLVYLLSNEYSVKNTMLLCDYLMYTDTFFYDVHPVIKMFVMHALELYPTEPVLLEWIISTYENHPDSPFDEKEILSLKKSL